MSNNTRAILLMIGALLCYSSMDAMAKSISQDTNTVMALWARYAGQAMLVVTLIAHRFRSVVRTNFLGLQLLRSVLLFGATGCFFLGLSYLGLAETTAILDVNPVLITLGAALFLGEKLGPRRLLAIAAGLAGTLIIIRPGLGVFSVHALLPLLAAVCYAGFALITRRIGPHEQAWTLLFWGCVPGAIVITALLPANWIAPPPVTMLKMLALALIGTAAQLLMIRALAIGEAAMLAPFAYVGLINATLIGILVFGEYPDRWTVLGAVVIVAAGVYVWHRETRGGKTQLPASAKTPPEGI